ncbi:MAG TPA: Spy/CpxP family protein refolding chaperone [Gemmatimonadales bacterium]|nr:Spy/CpxP family protein refolding chaperone [Gemmatimonadales bacterium]
MKHRIAGLVLAGTLMALGSIPLSAQEGPRAAALRRELELRFARQVQEQLQLSEEQTTKVRDIMSGYAERRRELELQERQLRVALNSQLRPGIAANPDSVNRLVDAIATGRVSYAQLVQEEMRELSTVLDPVQRGQLFLMRDRLLQRVQEMRQQNRMRPPR